MHEFTREEAVAMDGFKIEEMLLTLTAVLDEIAKEAMELVTREGKLSTELEFAERGSEEWKKLRGERHTVRAELRCNMIRKTLATKQANILQSVRKPVF